MKQDTSSYYFTSLSLCYLILLRSLSGRINHKGRTLGMVYCGAQVNHFILYYIKAETGLLGYNYSYLHLKLEH